MFHEEGNHSRTILKSTIHNHTHSHSQRREGPIQSKHVHTYCRIPVSPAPGNHVCEIRQRLGPADVFGSAGIRFLFVHVWQDRFTRANPARVGPENNVVFIVFRCMFALFIFIVALFRPIREHCLFLFPYALLQTTCSIFEIFVVSANG